jgi:hypothetical protein
MFHRRARAGIALAAVLLLAAACDDSPTEPGGPVRFDTVLKAILGGPPPDLEGRQVIRDRGAWEAVWDELHEGPPPPLPEIDFGREMAIVALGPGCGGSVEITSIGRERFELVVRGQARSCSNTLCFREDFSVHLVRLARSDGPVSVRIPTPQAGLC